MVWRVFDQWMTSVPFFDGIMATALLVTPFSKFQSFNFGEK